MAIKLSGDDRQGDFHILLDRQSALDIGAFTVDGVDLSPGTAIPSDGDRRIDHALQGFFFTCGPDHIRHPEPIVESGQGPMFPLHGSLCGSAVGRSEMSIAGEPAGCLADTEVQLADGGCALVSRRWTVNAETAEVMLFDRVTNTGGKPFAPMLMYHMNIGGWLLGDDTHIAGTMFSEEKRPWRFGEGESAHFCVPATETTDGGWAQVALGPFEPLSGRSLIVPLFHRDPAVPADVALPARLGRRYKHRAGFAPYRQAHGACRRRRNADARAGRDGGLRTGVPDPLTRLCN
jgi:hypothetical protein